MHDMEEGGIDFRNSFFFQPFVLLRFRFKVQNVKGGSGWCSKSAKGEGAAVCELPAATSHAFHHHRQRFVLPGSRKA